MLLHIEKLVYGGDGLARLPADEHGRGKAVFLPFVLEGEKVEATLIEQKTGFARASADAILELSPDRVKPHCPYFRACGGCHYQHSRYRHQLEIKASILKENLRRIAKLDLENELVTHPSPEWNYRNRTRLKVRNTPTFAVGYYKFGSHELLPVTECPISSPLINKAIAALWQLGSSQMDGLVEIEFFSDAEEKQLLAEVYCETEPNAGGATQFAEAMTASLPELAGVVTFKAAPADRPPIQPQQLQSSGIGELTYKTRHGAYRVSAGSFFQVNRHLIDELIQIVCDGEVGQTALDLYAGVGLFSTVLARSFAQVIAVEPSPTAHADLVYNSPSNVKSVRATTDQFLRNMAGNLRPDLVVVDPPRSGLGETVVRKLPELGASRILYVSCDPATASRDLAGLLKAGYRIQQAHVVDLFPQTYHVESVFHLVLS